jgi:hypothetical protein
MLDTFLDWKDNWDGEGAIAPNRTALDAARAFLDRLVQFGVRPDDARADVLGGISLGIFRAIGADGRADREVFIVCDNDGFITVILRDHPRGACVARPAFLSSMDPEIERIAAFLGGDR